MKRNKTLEKVGDKFKRQGVKVESADIEEDEERAEEFDIRAMPTFVAVNVDGEEVAREEGAMSLKELTAFVEGALEALDGEEDVETEDEDDED
jgi:thiol-disulfide isomerase/thioredoxin